MKLKNVVILCTCMIIVILTAKVYNDAKVYNNTQLGTLASVDMSVHNDYGVSYPITYIFDIRSDVASGAHAYKRYQVSDTWAAITEKTSNDFFNGIEAMRFDYTNHKAYVSVAFDTNYDKIYLRITDSAGHSIAKYNSIAKYYDNRKATVVIIGDDWAPLKSRQSPHENAAQACIDRNMWYSPGVETARGTNDWSKLQAKINSGLVEPCSHSRTHPKIPYSNYFSEINGSRQDLINNLTLPSQSRKGSTQYIYAWIEPYGSIDSNVRSQLAASHYLSDRMVSNETSPNTGYVSWESDGLFARSEYSSWMGGEPTYTPPCTTNVTILNSQFDAVYNDGGIYLLWCHPPHVDWSANSYAQRHLDHIANKKDVWYVGFGHVYLYRFEATRAISVRDG